MRRKGVTNPPQSRETHVTPTLSPETALKQGGGKVGAHGVIRASLVNVM